MAADPGESGNRVDVDKDRLIMLITKQRNSMRDGTLISSRESQFISGSRVCRSQGDCSLP